MRIVAGSRKGHTIHAPKGLETRPTSDRVRENVFNIVAPWVEGARVLDLYDYDSLARYLTRVLADDGLLVLESAAKTEPELPGLAHRTTRRYGSTRVTVFEHE